MFIRCIEISCRGIINFTVPRKMDEDDVLGLFIIG